MKKLVIAILVVSLMLVSATAYAAKGKGPGDGGFFTKFFNGVLGESWTKGPATDKAGTTSQTSTKSGQSGKANIK